MNWDELLSGNHLDEWQTITNDFLSSGDIRVPRWYLRHSSLSSYLKLELHGFSDASNMAFGCCVYLRCVFNESHCQTILITSRSRVAPVNRTTIPRLELKANLLLAELINTVHSELKCSIDISDIFCWTDSMICLYWIKNANKVYEKFIQNRLCKIRALYDINFWKYVESSRNPADIVSRGCTLNSIKDSDLWFHGPNYLNDMTLDWPVFTIDISSPNNLEELTFVTSNVYSVNLSFIDISRFSSYERLLHVTGWILRFVHRLKARRVKTPVNGSPNLSAEERDEALKLWIKHSQRDVMSHISYKQLRKDLRLIDVDGIIRCEGRLRNAPLPYNAKYPVFLPHDCLFAKLVIFYCHCLVLHNGLRETICELRNKFWIPKARSLIRSVILKCVVCRRSEGKAYSYPPSPPLPASRLSDGHSFKFTAVDYAGPLYVKDVYNCNTVNKAWIFLFTCFNSRSVLLDLVPDCTAASCIRGLRRFFGEEAFHPRYSPIMARSLLHQRPRFHHVQIHQMAFQCGSRPLVGWVV